MHETYQHETVPKMSDSGRYPHARNVPTPNHLSRRPSARPHPPTSFPRRRESTPLRPNPRRDGPPAVDGNRHNPTESDEPQRKLVPAREALASPDVIPVQAGIFSLHGDRVHGADPDIISTPSHVILALTSVIPVQAGIFSLHRSPPARSGFLESPSPKSPRQQIK